MSLAIDLWDVEDLERRSQARRHELLHAPPPPDLLDTARSWAHGRGRRRRGYPEVRLVRHRPGAGFDRAEALAIESGDVRLRDPQLIRRARRAGLLSAAQTERLLHPDPRRVAGTAWCLHLGVGLLWRLGLALAVVGALSPALRLYGPRDVLVAFCVAGLPGLLYRPWRAFWRWSLLSAAVSLLLLPTPLFGRALAGLIALAPVAALLAVRRWRLRGRA